MFSLRTVVADDWVGDSVFRSQIQSNESTRMAKRRDKSKGFRRKKKSSAAKSNLQDKQEIGRKKRRPDQDEDNPNEADERDEEVDEETDEAVEDAGDDQDFEPDDDSPMDNDLASDEDNDEDEAEEDNDEEDVDEDEDDEAEDDEDEDDEDDEVEIDFNDPDYADIADNVEVVESLNLSDLKRLLETTRKELKRSAKAYRREPYNQDLSLSQRTTLHALHRIETELRLRAERRNQNATSGQKRASSSSKPKKATANSKGTNERSNPSATLYSVGYKGRTLGIPEWVRWLLRKALTASKKSKKMTREAATGNLILVLSQIVYWSEPDQKDRPRSREPRSKLIDDIWWLVSSPSELAKQTGLGIEHVRVAIKRLADLTIIEEQTDATGRHGPNTNNLRVRWEIVEPFVADKMPVRSPRRGKRKAEEV